LAMIAYLGGIFYPPSYLLLQCAPVVYGVSLLQSENFRARVAGMFRRREVAA